MICDICNRNDAVYDGKTRMGALANMCEVCFGLVGSGLGLGKGQKIARHPSSIQYRNQEWNCKEDP